MSDFENMVLSIVQALSASFSIGILAVTRTNIISRMCFNFDKCLQNPHMVTCRILGQC